MQWRGIKPIKITQRRVDLLTMQFLWGICALLCIYFLISREAFFLSTVGTGLAIMSVFLLLYYKGYHIIAQIGCTVFITALTAMGLTEQYVTQQFAIELCIIPILGMLLLGRRGFLGSSILFYSIVLIRAGFTGKYMFPPAVILYLMYIGLVTILSFRFDTERIIAEENESKARQAQDEAERQRKALIEEEAQLKASIASFPRGYILTNLVGTIILTNELIRTIFELPAAPGSLTTIQQQLGEAFDIVSAFSHMMQNKEVVVVDEVKLRNKFLKIVLSPIRVEHGELIGGVILVEDITEEKILQRSRDEFFSIASHELRTPLTAIRGNTSMIKEYYLDQLKDSELRQMIEDIHDSSVRLIMIVNDFLATSRLEQGKITFTKEVTDIKALIESSVKEVEPMADEKKLSLTIILPNDTPLPPVTTDRDKIKEVLTNLLGNAIKYTEKGSIIVAVTHENSFVKVSVTDSGVGIPLQNQRLLFRKFQQASNNILTRDTTRSTGLGLYISKLIIESLGGKIYLEHSEEGKGSTFVFTVPVVADIQK